MRREPAVNQRRIRSVVGNRRRQQRVVVAEKFVHRFDRRAVVEHVLDVRAEPAREQALEKRAAAGRFVDQLDPVDLAPFT